jgi:RHS repeat-associated protein
VRLVTDGSGNVVSRHDYLPFGEEITGGYAGRTAALGFGGSEGVTQRFTGKERDQESGLDYFGARYYGSALGRFTSPDWSAQPQPVPYASLSNPQTLNLYQYMRNNPLGGADQDGHCDWCQKLWNGITGNGFQTDAQLHPGIATSTVTYAPNPDQTTTVSADFTNGVVVQAGFSVPNFSNETPGSLGAGVSYVPSSGEIFANGSLGTPGSGAYIVAGLTTNQDQSGPSVGGAAFAGIGGTVSLSLDPTTLKPNGDATFGIGFGTPGSSGLSVGGSSLALTVAPARANVTITAAPPNSTPIGDGLYTWEDWPHE